MSLSPIANLLASQAGTPAAATGGLPAGGAIQPFTLPEPPQHPGQPAAIQPVVSAEPFAASNWGHLMHQIVKDVNSRQAVAGELARDVLAGGPTKPHEAVIAMEEASVSFQMLAEMRNKLIESYQEVMRMQV
jgi:flagellar hook-basal body complex protein FliE